jgi:disulfide oxidoreductase YuzD
MKHIKEYKEFINESNIISKDDLINMQRKGARAEDTWDMIKHKDKDTKFELEKGVPISNIEWDEKNADIVDKQKRRIQRLKDKSDGSSYYVKMIKYEEDELGHIENLINMIKSHAKLNPIIVSKDYRVLDGYHRIGAYKHLGIKKVNVYREI